MLSSSSTLPINTQTDQLFIKAESNPTSGSVLYSGRSIKITNPVTSLLQLPNELLFLILDKINNYQDLQKMRCTCKEINNVICEFNKLKLSVLISNGLKNIKPSSYTSNHIFYEYMNKRGDWTFLGTELPDGTEYKTSENVILATYSHFEKECENKTIMKTIGVLNDHNKSKFILEGENNLTSRDDLEAAIRTQYFSCNIDVSGYKKTSPNWEMLFKEMQLEELQDTALGIKRFNHFLIYYWLENSLQNEENLRKKLIRIFNNTHQ